MNICKALLAVVLVGLFGGCATTDVPKVPEPAGRVAVVVVMSPVLRFHSMGYVPAFQSGDSVPAEVIDVREVVQSEAEAQFADAGFNRVDPTPELEAFAAGVTSRWLKDEQVAQLKALSAQADSVVVIFDGRNVNNYGVENGFGGIEVIPSKILGFKALIVSEHTEIVAFSTRTGARIGFSDKAACFREVREVPFHEKWKEFAESDQDKLIAIVKESVQDAIARGLTDLFKKIQPGNPSPVDTSLQ